MDYTELVKADFKVQSVPPTQEQIATAVAAYTKILGEMTEENRARALKLKPNERWWLLVIFDGDWSRIRR